jgi:hypothetical protein
MITDEHRKKTPEEVAAYKKFMEDNVRGIVWGVPDPYDKGWYDCIRWVLGEWP